MKKQSYCKYRNSLILLSMFAGLICVIASCSDGGRSDSVNDVPTITSGITDTSFGSNGLVLTDFGTSYEKAYVYAVGIQADGKIVALGTSYDSSGHTDFALARYSTDGSIDMSFGTSGKVTTDLGKYDWASAVALQSDGKILVAGTSTFSSATGSVYMDFALVRYKIDGSLDASYGINGTVATDFRYSYDYAHAIALQADGKVVVAGISYTNNIDMDFALARYNTDGSLDTTFGNNGKVTTDFGNSSDFATAIAIQANGKILVVGNSALARYNTDGSLDTSFGTSGKVIGLYGGRAVSIQADGKIVVAGSGNGFSLARYNSDGSLDTSFGNSGTVSTHFGKDAYAVAIQADGKIVAAGQDNGIAVARFNTDGSFDTTFGIHGTAASTDFGSVAYAVAIQADGKIVAAGSSHSGALYYDQFALARYLP